MEKFFGKQLISGNPGEYQSESVDSLKGKYVGIYFSAHWCPPCRGFTPKLIKFYNSRSKLIQKPLEIVFVSSDRNSEQFDEYFGSMPWKALPFGSPMKASLSETFEVEGIPTLVILDPQGNTLTDDGVSAVSEEDYDALFPKFQSAMDILEKASVSDNKGKASDIKSIFSDNEVVGLYFSAHWCPPCRMFTPQLVKAYNALKAQGKKIEIIFCSSDKNEAEHKEYFASMPWKSLGAKSPVKEQLSKKFKVEGIPTLVFLDSKGETISRNGRGLVDELDEFPWKGSGKPLKKLTSSSVDLLNKGPVALVIVDEQSEAKELERFLPVATEFSEKWKDEAKQPLSFVLVGSGDLRERVLGFLNIKVSPFFTIVNLPGGEKFYPTDGATKPFALNPEKLKAFVNDYVEGGRKTLTKLTPKQ